MAERKITDASIVDTLNDGDSVFINQDNALKQIEIADIVVEQGTINNWTYRKYASGTFDAWIKQSLPTISSSSWTASGGMYYGAVITTTFPFTVMADSGVASISMNHQCMASNVVVGTGSINFRPMRGAASTLEAAIFYMTLHGRWK